MKISVVIPVFNASRTIRACLEALERQQYPDFEVVLIDNNSTDASRAIIEDFLAARPLWPGKMLHEPRQGACAARNRGARAASGQVIANIDPDCLPEPGWLEELARAFADEAVVAVAGNIASRAPENVYELFSALYTLPGRQSSEDHWEYTLTRGGFATANLALRRDWFERLGGFDETINYQGVGIGEDHDILARLYRQGGLLRAVPNATVVHWHRATLRGIVRQGFLFGLAHALLTRYHARPGLLVSALGREFRVPFPGKGWVDLEGLDKKVALLVMAAGLYPAAGVLLALYLLLQVKKIGTRARQKGVRAKVAVLPLLLLLLLAKSAAMSLGRLQGSLLKRVFCI